MVCVLLTQVVMATNWFCIKPEASGLVMEYIPPMSQSLVEKEASTQLWK